MLIAAGAIASKVVLLATILRCRQPPGLQTNLQLTGAPSVPIIKWHYYHSSLYQQWHHTTAIAAALIALIFIQLSYLHLSSIRCHISTIQRWPYSHRTINSLHLITNHQ